MVDVVTGYKASDGIDLGSKLVDRTLANKYLPWIDVPGGLWLWGSNGYGYLGDSTDTARSSPVQTISGGTTWSQIACGSQHTAAIKIT